jgi:hypothetical protein
LILLQCGTARRGGHCFFSKKVLAGLLSWQNTTRGCHFKMSQNKRKYILSMLFLDFTNDSYNDYLQYKLKCLKDRLKTKIWFYIQSRHGHFLAGKAATVPLLPPPLLILQNPVKA